MLAHRAIRLPTLIAQWLPDDLDSPTVAGAALDFHQFPVSPMTMGTCKSASVGGVRAQNKVRQVGFDIHVFFRAVPRRGLLSFRGK